jgi:hypothetical protein
MKNVNLQTDSEKLQFLLAELQATAAKQPYADEEDYDSTANGNFDDTLEDGIEYGEVLYARGLLAKLAE